MKISTFAAIFISPHIGRYERFIRLLNIESGFSTLQRSMFGLYQVTGKNELLCFALRAFL